MEWLTSKMISGLQEKWQQLYHASIATYCTSFAWAVFVGSLSLRLSVREPSKTCLKPSVILPYVVPSPGASPPLSYSLDPQLHCSVLCCPSSLNTLLSRSSV
ncbi:hypothetical protein M758_UG029900 [Ceratodon purpureus]|nr:hypothetical protein M758_UG029900 [Ceratodon purpureus]